jgi:hypothetical protein
VFDVDLNLTRFAGEGSGAGRGLRGRAGAAISTSPLPESAFELLVVTRYLQRDLFDAIRAAVVRTGWSSETFTVNRQALGSGPTSPAHLLQPDGCGRGSTFDITILRGITEPEAVARSSHDSPS